MAIYEIKDVFKSFVMETATEFTLPHQSVNNLLERVVAFHQQVPVDKIELTRTSINPYRCSYVLTLVDGRVWSQVIEVSNGSVRQSFNVPALWSELKEFVPHRTVRDAFLSMIHSFAPVKIEIVW